MAISRDYGISLRRRNTTVTQHKSSRKDKVFNEPDQAVRICAENCKNCVKEKAQLDTVEVKDVFVIMHLLEDLLKIYPNLSFCAGGRDIKITNAHFSNMCNPSLHAKLIREIIKRIEARQ